MKAKHRTGYGIFDLSRQVARRVQAEWDMVEQPNPPPMRLTSEFFPRPASTQPPRPEKRPLAA